MMMTFSLASRRGMTTAVVFLLLSALSMASKTSGAAKTASKYMSGKAIVKSSLRAAVVRGIASACTSFVWFDDHKRRLLVSY
jgi:hypothetical protein